MKDGDLFFYLGLCLLIEINGMGLAEQHCSYFNTFFYYLFTKFIRNLILELKKKSFLREQTCDLIWFD